MGGISPAYYLATSSYLSLVGGTRAGTLSSWLDLPGYMLASVFFQSYPNLLTSGGWAAVLGRLQVRYTYMYIVHTYAHCPVRVYNRLIARYSTVLHVHYVSRRVAVHGNCLGVLSDIPLAGDQSADNRR